MEQTVFNEVLGGAVGGNSVIEGHVAGGNLGGVGGTLGQVGRSATSRRIGDAQW